MLPLPLKLDAAVDRVSIFSEDGEVQFDAATVGACESDPYGYPYDGAEGHGAEIVRAVNSQQKLLAACREALERFNSDGWPLNEQNTAAIAQLQSAIRAAEKPE